MSLRHPVDELYAYSPAPMAEFEVRLASDLVRGDWIVRDGAAVQLVLVSAEREKVRLQWRGDAHCLLGKDDFVAYLPLRRSLSHDGLNGKVPKPASADDT